MMKRKAQLHSKALAWAKPGELPTEFALFYFGANESTKGTVWLDAAHAKEAVAIWQDYGNDLAGDYEHGAAKANNKEAVPASCWFGLDVRPDGLYAVGVEWTDTAKKKLLSREYRYYSPWFFMEQCDDGKWYVVEIMNVALTNQPATKRQRPLVASRWTRTTLTRTQQRRHSMFDQETVDKLREIMKKRKMPPEEIDGAILDMVALDGPETPDAPEPMAAADTPAPEPAPEPAQYDNHPVIASLQGQLAKQQEQIALLTRGREAEEKRQKDNLFAEFDRQGKLRYADKKEARALLDNSGIGAFTAAFGRVPSVEAAAPAAPADNKSTATGSTSTASDDVVKLPGTAHPALLNRQGNAPIVEDSAVREYIAKHPGMTYGKALRAVSAELKRKAS